jgi:Toprim domain
VDQGTANPVGQITTQSDQPFLDHLDFSRDVTDIPCPICGPYAKAAVNKRRKVMRVWNTDGRVTYNCARCGAQGRLQSDFPLPRVVLPPKDNNARKALADRLWGMSYPLGRTHTPVETYLRSRGCYLPCPSIRSLLSRKNHPPTMIAKFQGTSGVHLTKLRLDGSGKAGTDHDKVMIGAVSGFPIVLRSGEWSKPLLICEGIEDGLSLALAFPTWTVWAAGSASMIHKLVGNTPKEVVVVVDYDMAGIKAVKRCFSINPDTRIIRFPKGLDANAMLVNRGLNALKDFVTRHQPFHR